MSDKEHPRRLGSKIAKEVSKEQNPERFWELTIELDKALEAGENKKKTRKSAQGSFRRRRDQS